MFLGHYAASLAAKKFAPRASLGTLVFAGQFLDLLWPILLIAGLEEVRIEPGLTAVSPLDFVSYPISHSLLAVAGWALVIGLAYYAVRRYRVGAWVVGALVLSHWFLDVPVHVPDLPLWPGSDILLGGGIWHSRALTLLVEFSLLALGLWFYLRATRARDRIGRWGLWAGVAFLSLAYLSVYVATPTEVDAVIMGGLSLWLFVPWAWWVDRHRDAEPARGATAIEPAAIAR